MKKLTVVIPTRFRLKKLIRCLDSLPAADFIDKIYVVCDGDRKTYEYIKALSGDLVRVIYVPEHKGSVYCRNLVTPLVDDGLLYAVDDIVFDEGAIEMAFASFNLRYFNDDGVVGFHQNGVNGTGHPTGVALMGKKFLQRYEGKQPFYPGYFHFSCQEIHWLAEKHGRFFFEERASLYHFHPQFDKTEMDQAHDDARIHKKADHDLIKARMAAESIWGDTNE